LQIANALSSSKRKLMGVLTLAYFHYEWVR